MGLTLLLRHSYALHAEAVKRIWLAFYCAGISLSAPTCGLMNGVAGATLPGWFWLSPGLGSVNKSALFRPFGACFFLLPAPRLAPWAAF